MNNDFQAVWFSFFYPSKELEVRVDIHLIDIGPAKPPLQE